VHGRRPCRRCSATPTTTTYAASKDLHTSTLHQSETILHGRSGRVLDKNDLKEIAGSKGIRMQPARVRVLRHESPQMRFELAFAAPDDALRAYVREYVGWFERSTVPVCRRELPSGDVPLIINFDSTVRERKAESGEWNAYGTFTAALHEAYTLVESTGPSHGIQVNFTAIGARLFYDRPLVEFTNRTVELDDVLGTATDLLLSRLYDAASWEERFGILDQEIGSRIECARQPPAAVAWAWQQLMKTGGGARITDLVRATAWSERHFVAQFRENVGLTPKAFARVLRFSRAVRLMTNSRARNLADVAQTCGYYDQAHFARDFRAFAGVAPSALLKSRLPSGAGFRSDD
jgi:AraC-like DNA-binding protein